jgi:Fe-S cluster assembly protein SufD
MLEPQFQELLSVNDDLSPWRKRYWDKFRDLGSLQLQQEAFQYIPLSRLSLPKMAKKNKPLSHCASQHPFRVVFIDGFFSEENSLLPEDVVCLSLDQAIGSYGLFLQNRMVKSLSQETDPLAALNGAFQGGGVFLYIPPKIELSSPIHVEHFFTGSDMTTPRLVVYLGKMARLEIVQHLHTKNEESHFVNAHIDATLDAGSYLSMKNLQKKAEHTTFFQSISASLKRDSQCVCKLYSEGAMIARTQIRMQLLEENANACLQGINTLSGHLHHHIHATMDHLSPNTFSRQHFKSLLRDNSCTSFEGKIYVHPSAQKTESYQLNNALLLSDEARVYAKPKLEIFADDVKASHGATVSQLDEESLFYLTSRGLPKEEARKYLIESFIQELVSCLP